MKASFFMFFEYLAMMGVPVLLAVMALNALAIHSGTLEIVLRIVIGAGCLAYGAVGIREVFLHGRRGRETTHR